MAVDKELTAALWSLREDATFAWKQAIEGNDSGLAAVGRAIKILELAVMKRDAAAREQPQTGA